MYGADGDDVTTSNGSTIGMYGGGGNDRFVSGAAADLIDGGDGTDTVDYHNATTSVAVQLLAGGATGTGGGGDQISNVENVDGSSFGDTVQGSDDDNMLRGMSGDDTLSGGAGADVLTGGAGADIFRDTATGLNGDTITDLAAGDRITITDANASSFAFTLSGTTLSYTGGTLTLQNLPTGYHLVAAADAAGGVDLTLVRNPADDFNGDGRSDILWRNDSGQVCDWLGKSNGGFIDNSAVVHNVVANSWHIAGTGDFNSDGYGDILWRNDSGQVCDWLGKGSGGFIDNSAVVHNVVANSWHITGTGDFNGDGRSDILWRNDSGQLNDWLGTSNGGFTDNGAVVHDVVPTSWHVQPPDLLM